MEKIECIKHNTNQPLTDEEMHKYFDLEINKSYVIVKHSKLTTKYNGDDIPSNIILPGKVEGKQLYLSRYCNSMFAHTNNLVKNIDLHNIKDASNITTMWNMFLRCESLETINLSGFNSDSVVDMLGMFQGCKSLKRINLQGFKTTNVESMAFLFNSCFALEKVDLSSFSTSRAADFSWMFSDCISLRSVDLQNFKLSEGCCIDGMFYKCKNRIDLKCSDNQIIKEWNNV